MKAVVLERYGEPEDLELRDVPRPEPGPEEVLVRVGAASVNDWDWNLVRGRPFYIHLFCGLIRPKVRIPGVDVAGEVVAVGSAVTDLAVGERVFGDLSESGFGAFAEYVSAPREALSRAPENLSFEEAAGLPHAAALAQQALFDVADLQPGDTLLVNGAGGGVGTLAVQLAKELGVEHVVGVDAAHKHEAMRAAGYDETIDYRERDFTRLGQVYDVVLDTRSTRGPRAVARALRPGGRYVTVGGDTSAILRVALLGRFVGQGKTFRLLALRPNQGLERMRELCERGVLRVVVDRVFPLDEAPQALRRFGEARHTGKAILKPGEAL